MIRNKSIIVALVLLCQILGCIGRPTEVPDSCTPGKEYECPSTYSCFGTGIPGVGYCNCAAYYAFVRAPPTLDTLATDEYTCASSGLPWTMAVIVLLVVAIGNAQSIHEQIVLAIRLKKHGVLKNNVATRLLFLNFWGNNIAHFGIMVIMLMNMFKIDPNMYLHDYIRSVFFGMMALYRFPIVFEALVAWIDIVQKSATLTRTMSKGLTIIQYLLRVAAIFIAATAMWLYYKDKKIQYVNIDMQLHKILPVVILLAAWRLNSILCPKMDKKSKNYSKAYGIWVLAITVVICMCGYYSGIQMFIRNFFDASMGNFTAFGTAFWHISDLICGKAWIAYIKRGNKKILSQYESGGGGIMGLFASSVASSTASSVSVIEKDGEDTVGRKSAMENIKEEA